MAEARARFGIFEFDAATRELWREGVAVRLQAQPAQALALLVANAGEVVTREALRRDLWGEETHVDFDRGLNFCIGQIRIALGDSAESPRFIRTLPKRGYQFIAPVTRPAPAPVVELPKPRSRMRLAASVLAGLALAAGTAWWFFRPTAPLPSVTIAVTRFDNQTGDAAFTRFADTLTDSVVGELATAGGGRYGVIGNASILRGPRETRDLLAIGSSLRAAYVVIGQVQRDGPGIRILAHLIRMPDQKHVWVERADSMPDQAERMQSDLARRIAKEFSRRLDADRAAHISSSALVIR
jgi:DNA-binding winged helix-turn-helix (wHTH) protein/TolB-like protein